MRENIGTGGNTAYSPAPDVLSVLCHLSSRSEQQQGCRTFILALHFMPDFVFSYVNLTHANRCQLLVWRGSAGGCGSW